MFKNQEKHCYTIVALIAISAMIVGSFALRSQVLQPATAQNPADQAGKAMGNVTGKAGQMMGNVTGNKTAGNQSGNPLEQAGKALKGLLGGK
jgi:hypothetical protein